VEAVESAAAASAMVFESSRQREIERDRERWSGRAERLSAAFFCLDPAL
jgi:hypothetical protein